MRDNVLQTVIKTDIAESIIKVQNMLNVNSKKFAVMIGVNGKTLADIQNKRVCNISMTDFQAMQMKAYFLL